MACMFLNTGLPWRLVRKALFIRNCRQHTLLVLGTNIIQYERGIPLRGGFSLHKCRKWIELSWPWQRAVTCRASPAHWRYQMTIKPRHRRILYTLHVLFSVVKSLFVAKFDFHSVLFSSEVFIAIVFPFLFYFILLTLPSCSFNSLTV